MSETGPIGRRDRVRGMLKVAVAACVVWMTAGSQVAHGQFVMGALKSATVTAKVEPGSAAPGQKVRLMVRIPLGPGEHVYGPAVKKPYFATNVTVKTPGPVEWKKPAYPPTKKLTSGGETVEVLEGDAGNGVNVELSGTVKSSAPAGEQRVEISVTYQACTESSCSPPVKGKVIGTTIIVGGQAATTSIVGAGSNAVAPGEGSANGPVGKEVAGFGARFSVLGYEVDLGKLGFWLPLAVAFMAGLILNVMPCVLPVIPIKILQLTKQAHQEHHSPVRLSLIFSGGIVSFFVLIGVVAIVLKNGFSWGQPFQNPTLLIGICLVLVALALGMFDVYQIVVPNAIAGREIVQKGYLGAFSMGFLAGILSTPCSFGILGAAVAWAQSQIHYVTVLAFLTIGVGMASPYVVLSGFPKLINKVPHTGRWSELFKEAMGFILLGVAAFLVSALPKDRILPTLLYFILFAFIIWFWGVVLEFKAGRWAKVGRLIVIVGLAVTCWGMFKPVVKALPWKAFSAQTLKEAEASGKTTVIEFTADWCLNCKSVEYLVYGDAEVKAALKEKGTNLLKADMTESDGWADGELKRLTGQSGIPFTVVLKPDGERVLLQGIYQPEALLKAIE